MEHLRCVVERITYQSEESGYTVLKCAAKHCSELVTVVGSLPKVHVGAVLSLEGSWKVNPKYGRQFAVEKFEETLPATVHGIERYLSSGLIKGIGPKYAQRIVQKFGKDTLEVIEKEPERLLEIPGIGRKLVDRVQKGWAEQQEIKHIMLFLQDHDVSTAHATKIFKTYGSDSIRVVQENPYRLADDIWGIGFKTADLIAGQLGMGKDNAMRLRCGLMYALNQLADAGHCFALRDQLLNTGVKLLEAPEDSLDRTLTDMLQNGDVIREEEAIYLPPFYYAEVGCARKLRRLVETPAGRSLDVTAVLDRVAASQEITYDPVQWTAIRTALTSKVMVLTGGPGTGKTTTTTGILAACQAAGCRILLAAPTGRAAKRMTEATGMEAKTIHRLLEYKPPGGYQRNEDSPLEGDVLILDECSMIDLLLMYNLLKALPPEMTLILVGDTDQLPSVGAGSVLGDIISSGTVPVVRLTQIFRQAQGSRIILNAHRINRGEAIDLRGGKDSDFFFLARDSSEDVRTTLIQYVTQNLPAYYQVDPIRDIQILTPMQKGPLGAAALNEGLQQALNPSGPCLRRAGVTYRLRDKVMQIRNDYEKEVFNGDIGTVCQLDPEERTLTVEYDGREVAYDLTELDELVLAYATTIHKAQGSEFPIVVMPVTMSHYIMLQRNLLYTGVTRAKRVLLLIGERKAISYAISQETTTARNTKLAQRLKGGPSPAAPQNPSLNALFARLARSDFRSGFALGPEERAYVRQKGMDTIRSHARDFVAQRLAPEQPAKDGSQTPMKGHPVFLAQHATGTCCRSCLEKWHHIPKGTPLTQEQCDYVVEVIMTWIQRQMDLKAPAGAG